MEQFTKEMLSRLDALASKLGMAANAIWGFYLRQAKVEGVTYAILAALVLLLAFGCAGVIGYYLIFRREFILGKAVVREVRDTYDFGMSHRTQEQSAYVGGYYRIFWLVVPALGFGALGSYWAYLAVTALYNPGFYAFQQILSQLKGN